MIVLGLNAYHGDSSACLVVDGQVINAIEEERIKRVKHWAGLPIEAIKWCLGDAKISLSDVDYIAISREPAAHLYKKILMGLTRMSMHRFVKDRFFNILKITDIKASVTQSLGLDPLTIMAKVENVEHHKAHIASAFLVSPFDEAVCISVDGFGDFLSTMRAIGRGTDIKIIDWVEYPHSLGVFYTAMTQYLGFWNYGDEYKVMGLSAYGKPLYLDRLREVVKLKRNGLFQLDTSFFIHATKGVEMVWENGIPTQGRLFSDKIIDLFGKPRLKEDEITQQHQDIATSIQAIYEEVFFHMLNNTHEKCKVDNLALAGGCIQNSLANGKIYSKTPFKNVYIPPAAYDAGLAIGAAMDIWYKKSRQNKKHIMLSPYQGPSFTKIEIENEINNYSHEIRENSYAAEYLDDETLLCKKTAKFIASGKVVGWFQGRTEFGPRALGNRSIIADPRREEMKDILNARVKRREWFRPFAPSILEEKTNEWFECDNPVPFMEKVYKIKENKQKLIPAVCHLDGTGRLQTVSCALNEKYYMLINQFDQLTGVPIVLNTSFNDNEPIVNTPAEALRCFFGTKMDILILGGYIISKNEK